jgi:hypothetical protein
VPIQVQRLSIYSSGVCPNNPELLSKREIPLPKAGISIFRSIIKQVKLDRQIRPLFATALAYILLLEVSHFLSFTEAYFD